MIHLDRKCDRPPVIEFDRVTVGAGAATDMGVDVIRAQFGHTHLDSPE